MAKTSPTKARARPKSKPTKAGTRGPVASRAKREAQIDAPPPDLKAPRTKSAQRRTEPPAAPKAAVAPKARYLGASFEGKAIGSSAAPG